MPITNHEKWNALVKASDDPCSKDCIDVARKAMEILDNEPGDFDVHKLIRRAKDECKAGNITFFVAGYVASSISAVHSRGEEFRLKWNESTQIHKWDTSEGLLNPIIPQPN